jgi:hypothetical protein
VLCFGGCVVVVVGVLGWERGRGGGGAVVGGGRKSGVERGERKVGLRDGGDADSGHSRRYDLSQCTQKLSNRFSRKTDVWESGVA